MIDSDYSHPFESITVDAPGAPTHGDEWTATVVVRKPPTRGNTVEFGGWFQRHGRALIAKPRRLPGGSDRAVANRIAYEVGRELADHTGCPMQFSVAPETRGLAHGTVPDTD